MPANVIKRFLIVIAAGVLLALSGYAVYRGYRHVRQTHLVNQARQFLAASDVKNASLCLERALRYNPADPDACRLMADLAEAEHAPSALIWRSRVVEYDPTSSEDRLALAESAIRGRDFATAAEALDGIKAADKDMAGFHEVSGALATSQGQRALAEEHYRAVAHLEPTNMNPLLNIAVLHLQGTNAADLGEARMFLRGLASNPTNSELRWRALRELTADAMRHRETNAALSLSLELLKQTNSVFGDQLLRLDVLADTRSAEFKSALAAAQRQAASDTARVMELGTWQAAKLPSADVLAWLTSLPKATQTNQAVAILMAECYAGAHDWRNLQGYLEPQNWGEMDFIRHGFLARALRGQEMVDTAKIEWEKGLKGARVSRQRLLMLLSMAVKWEWKGEQEDLLWAIINEYPADQGAFQALAKTLFLEGRTRSLLQLYNQAGKRDPANLPLKNNVAFAALLLGAEEYKPFELARQVYVQAPTNSACVSTYALSLLLQRKNTEALKVIEGLDPRELNNPSTAGFYGLALYAAGQPNKAKPYLEFGAKAPMLPEERTLIERAIRGT
jgi:Flp pilus assembly protein TadD